MGPKVTVRDSAVLFFVLGLLAGMIVAFASCSAEGSDTYRQPQQTQHTQPLLTGGDGSTAA